MLVKQAAHAWKLYPSNPQILFEFILECANEAEKIKLKNNSISTPRILISPHAWYMFSWVVAASWYNAFRRNQSLSKIIIIWPSHNAKFQWIWFSKFEKYSTPLGEIDVDKEIYNYFKSNNQFQEIDENNEHSIELQIPFLQSIMKIKSIAPIIIWSTANIDILTDRIIELMTQNEKIWIIISSDLSHYQVYEKANQKDLQTINFIEKNLWKEITEDMACWNIGISMAIMISEKLWYKNEKIFYANSWDTFWDKTNVVWYLSMIFW